MAQIIKQYKVSSFTLYKTLDMWFYPYTDEGYNKAKDKRAELLATAPSYASVVLEVVQK